MNIPESALLDILCGVCQNPLIGVTHTFPKQEISTCKKCTATIKERNFREIAYEVISSNFLFPCRNEGCDQKLTPVKLKQHMTICPYVSRRCLLECGWRGIESQLLEHFTTAHPAKILNHNTDYKFNFKKPCFPRLLLKTEEQCFLIQKSIKDGFFNVSVSFPYNSPKKDEYRVALIAKNERKEFLLKYEPDEEKEKMCCKFSTAGNDEIILSILVLNNNISIPTPPPENKHLLKSLTCTICKRYMDGKVYFCIKSHNACFECKNVLCFCQYVFRTRNYALEILMEACLYPCRYSKCPQIIKFSEKKSHELHCEFSTFPCPICSKAGFTRDNIRTHFNSTHKFYMMKSGHMEFEFTEASVIDCFFLFRETGYFRLVHKYSNRNFLFAVQYFGKPELAERYTFCVSAKNSTGAFRGEKKCAKFGELEEAFCNGESYLAVPASMLKPFIKGKTLYYFLEIYRKIK